MRGSPKPKQHLDAAPRPRPRNGARAGRPTAARVEAIERGLLAAARAAFREHGFDAASMEAIAAAAGVSKGTLYSRYSTKDALLRAVVEDQIAAWTEERSPTRGPMPDDFKLRLKFHARAMLESLMSDPVRAFEAALRSPAGPAHDLAQALYRTARAQTIDDVSREVESGTRDFPAPPRDKVMAAEMFMAMVYGWWSVNHMIRTVTPADAEAYLDYAVDVFFAGRSAW